MAVEDFVRVAAVAEIPPGRMLAVRVQREDVVLYNVDGTIHASRDFCPHAGYQLSKSAFIGKYVRCSLHAWEFDVSNGEYTGNPRIHLKCFPVKILDGEVWISLLPVIPSPPPKPPPLRDDA
ncbi:MAG: Rieske 2Fe-2S domain-containing protein [Planctomycetes bacterium]|nr:Rieske 2Fe-2S domain-containing protein [Planctomycetota bacterium]